MANPERERAPWTAVESVEDGELRIDIEESLDPPGTPHGNVLRVCSMDGYNHAMMRADAALIAYAPDMRVHALALREALAAVVMVDRRCDGDCVSNCRCILCVAEHVLSITSGLVR